MALAVHGEEVARGESLTRTADDLLSRALRLLSQAEADGDRKGALAAIRECRGVVETLGRLVGDIDASVQVNVGTSGQQVIEDVHAFQAILLQIAQDRHPPEMRRVDVIEVGSNGAQALSAADSDDFDDVG